MHGRYPDYDVVREAPHWDEVTRRVVLDRIEKVPDIRFFSDAEARTLGVAHPVLPCGARIYISYGGHKVLTQVIDRGPSAPGREFDVTKALADEIGLHGTKRIRWSYAR